MVVGIAKHYIEYYSTVKLSQILAYIYATLKNEINNVEIAIPCATASSIVKAKQ